MKHFARLKQRTALRNLFSLPPPAPPSHPLPNKTSSHLTRSLKKIFLRRYIEIYRHLLSKYFKNAVLGRQEMVQCKYFFWHQTETCLLENLLSQEEFRLCCGSILLSMSSELRFVKWVSFFERNCCKMCDLFC